MKMHKNDNTNVTITKMRNGQYCVNFITTLPSKSLMRGRKNNENNIPDEASKCKLCNLCIISLIL